MQSKKNSAILPICLVDWYKSEVKYPLEIPTGTMSYFEVDDNPGFVYVMYNHQSKMYKIGLTRDLRNRIRCLSNQSGCKIDLVLAIQLHSNYDESPELVEKNLHVFFAKKRTHGEWFDLGVKDLIRIRDLFWHIFGEYIIDNIKEVLSNKKS